MINISEGRLDDSHIRMVQITCTKKVKIETFGLYITVRSDMMVMIKVM